MIIHSQIFDGKSRRGLADYTCSYQTCFVLNYDDFPAACEEVYGKAGGGFAEDVRVVQGVESGVLEQGQQPLVTFMGRSLTQNKTGQIFHILAV